MTEVKIQVGDIVTRDGTDRQRVLWINEIGDLVEVECIQEPLGFLQEDGVTRGEPWCRVGERETNLTSRYSHLDTIEIEQVKPQQTTVFAQFQQRVLEDMSRAASLPFEELCAGIDAATKSRVRHLISNKDSTE